MSFRERRRLKIAGIICEYNPIHGGHLRHIEATRKAIGEECAVVCAMSGNFVQRGDVAIFAKHARAAAAVACGADLVIELPVPYALSSAEWFARAGVMLLDKLGVCTHISFGSEAGEVGRLLEVAQRLLDPETSEEIRAELKSGVSYAAARYRAVKRALGGKADILREPNNILGVEYLKALIEIKSAIEPVTVRRFGAMHDSEGAESASHLRRLFREGNPPWGHMPAPAAAVFASEMAAGRGPVFLEALDQAIMARLRMLPEEAFDGLPDATEGLGRRLFRCARTMPTVAAVLEAAKTKRYPMSRLRRMVMCAALGIGSEDCRMPPQYVRVLALSARGRALLREIKAKCDLPVVTKPALSRFLNEKALKMFEKEAAATDFYVLAYPDPENRAGGQEWTTSPRVV